MVIGCNQVIRQALLANNKAPKKFCRMFPFSITLTGCINGFQKTQSCFAFQLDCQVVRCFNMSAALLSTMKTTIVSLLTAILMPTRTLPSSKLVKNELSGRYTSFSVARFLTYRFWMLADTIPVMLVAYRADNVCLFAVVTLLTCLLAWGTSE